MVRKENYEEEREREKERGERGEEKEKETNRKHPRIFSPSHSHSYITSLIPAPRTTSCRRCVRLWPGWARAATHGQGGMGAVQLFHTGDWRPRALSPPRVE